MTSRLKSGRFWLKLLALGSMALSLLIIGSYIVLHQMIFKPDRLHEAARNALHGSGFNLYFDKNISRSWLPRPTVTLRNVVLSNQNKALAQAKEIRIGLAWSSLLSKPAIEKWVIKHADIHLEQNDEGRWNFHNLRHPGQTRLNVNRLIIENSRIEVQTPNDKIKLAGINFKLSESGGGNRRFQISGKAEHAYLNLLNWHGSGSIQRTASGWSVPDLRLDAAARYRGQSASLTANTALQWQHNRLTFSQINANIKSPFYQTNINTSVPTAEWQNGRFLANRINNIINARRQQTEISGTLNLNDVAAGRNHIRIGLASLNAASRAQNLTGLATLNSEVNWQSGQGWQLPDLKIITRQNQPQNQGGPRFITALSGHFQTKPNGSWQTRLSGLFDHQLSALEAEYEPEKRLVKASIGLNKLVFAPYLNDFRNQTVTRYPELLTGSHAVALDLNLRLDLLQLPKLTASHIQTRLQAGKNHISLTDFSAELYGGTTHGSLSIENQTPLAYRLQQQARDVQILPLMQDLLRYNKLAGFGDAAIDFTTRGNNRQDLTRNLHGRLNLKLQEGALIGININNILNQNHPAQAKTTSTPFKRFTLNSLIQNGVSRHQNAELITNKLHILSNGSVDLNRLTMNENMLVSITGSTAPPIPLTIQGLVDNPSVTLNYNSLTRGLITPEEKQKALSDTLKRQWDLLSKP